MGDPGRDQIVKEITRLTELLNKAEKKAGLRELTVFRWLLLVEVLI